MTIFGFIILLLIAAVCGGIGQSIAGYSFGGCLMSVVVGFIGALIGKWMAVQLGFPMILPVSIGGQTFPIIWSIIGSTILSLGIGLIVKGRSRLF